MPIKKTRRLQRFPKQKGGDADRNLWNAIIRSKIADVKKALENGANVNMIMESSLFKTPLNYVCARVAGAGPVRFGIIKSIIQTLLDAGANTMIPNDRGEVPLQFLQGTEKGLEIMRMLLEHGADPNFQNNDKETVLQLAVIKRDQPKIKLLLEYSADPHIPNIHGQNAFDMADKISYDSERTAILELLNTAKSKTNAAIANGDPNKLDAKGFAPLHQLAYSAEPEDTLIEKAKQLLELGANLELPGGKSAETPLISAIHANKPQLAAFLLEAGANPNVQNRIGSTLLQYAAQEGLLEFVQRFQSLGQDIRHTNRFGLNALHYACNQGHLPVVQYLVSQGVDINALTSSQLSPLYYCVSGHAEETTKNRLACADFLLQNGANPNLGKNILLLAAQEKKKGSHHFIPLLLVHGADANTTDTVDNFSILQIVILEKGTLETVKALVEAGANVNYISKTDDTALGISMINTYRNIDIARYLLEKGADPNKGTVAIKDSSKQLHQPVAFVLFPNVLELLPLFLEKGQDPNVMGPGGSDSTISLLYLAIHHKKPEALKLILEAGGNPNQIMESGTLLHHAVNQGQLNSVKILLEKGASINSQDMVKRMTPLYLAIVMYNQKINELEMLEIMKFLVASGADLTLKTTDGETPVDLIQDEETEKALGILKLWEGFTRSDITFLNNIFTEETRPRRNNNNNNVISKANDYTLCPVCLKTTERDKGCNHMSHDCKGLPGFYHKALYKTYQSQGKIHWCTICNRIGYGMGTQFEHYKLGLAKDAKPKTAGHTYLFDADCRTRSGGGGLPEKYHRFNTLRNVALRFNYPSFIGQKPFREVMEKLVEAMWNAPLHEDPLAEIKFAERKWNKPNTNFPLPRVLANANNTNIPTPNTVQDPVIHPVETEDWQNATLISEENIIQFRHPGHPHDKPGQQISRKGFAGWLKESLGNYTGEEFGHCWQYMTTQQQTNASPDELANHCEALLWPREVRIALGITETPEAGENAEYRKLYEGYKKQFNRKQRGSQ